MRIKIIVLVGGLALPVMAMAQPAQPAKPQPTQTDKSTTSKPGPGTSAQPGTTSGTAAQPGTTGKPATGTTGAQPGTAMSPPITLDMASKGQLSDGDYTLLAHHHNVNLMEIDMGKMAKERGSARAVKAYGTTLITDHTKADKQSQALAKKKGASLVDHALPAGDETARAEHDKAMATMERLRGLEGEEFDREFLTAMVEDHTKELAKVDAALATVTDPQLKAHLKKVRPTLKKHADKARALQQGPKAAIK